MFSNSNPDNWVSGCLEFEQEGKKQSKVKLYNIAF